MCTFVPGVCVPVKLPALSNLGANAIPVPFGTGHFCSNYFFFIFGATNDSWADAPLGEAKYEGVTREDRYFVLPAICDFIRLAKETAPEARIIYIINSDLKDEIVNTIIEASKRYQTEYLLLENVDKQFDHPTVLGMKQIKEQVAKMLI